MSTVICPVDRCDRPRRGDQQICGACAGQLARALGDIPMLATQLDISLSRQTSNSGGGRSAETPMPYDLRASEAAYILKSTLVSWVHAISEQDNLAQPADTLEAMARWLLARHAALCGYPAAEEAVDQICAAVRNAERAIDRPAERWFAGPCSCGTDLYAKPGAPVVTCRDCGLTYDVADRRKWLLEASEDQLAYGALIAHALTTMGQPVTPERIRTWAARGRIIAHGTDPRGRPQYRVGDVRELLLADAHREQGRRDKVAS